MVDRGAAGPRTANSMEDKFFQLGSGGWGHVGVGGVVVGVLEELLEAAVVVVVVLLLLLWTG